MKTAAITISLFFILTWAGVAGAQNADYHFHWTPCPVFDEDDGNLSPAVQYEVWLKKGSAPEELLITQRSDTTYVLSAEPGVVQRLRVRGIDEFGRLSEMSDWSDPLYFEGGRSGETPPAAAKLRPNYPNPFNPETRIVYGVPDAIDNGDPARLDIYNLAGVRIRTFEVDRSPGWHELTWDGTNDHGQTQATGMYVTKFTVGAMVSTHKMTMVK